MSQSPIILSPRVESVLGQFRLSDDQLQKIVDMMIDDFRKGLDYGCPESSAPMLLTFLPALPDGSVIECGRYLAIDLSGTSLRCMLLTLPGKDGSLEVFNHNFVVTKEIMQGSGEELFDFLAQCLHKFLGEYDLLAANLPLSFVFSYPCHQTGIRSSRLLWWTKGFSASGVIDKDVVRLLEAAIAKRGDIKVRVMAIMNDTVGQLAAAAYQHGLDCMVGLVVGNGCNASYLEDIENIKKFNAKEAHYNHSKMVIDTEWEEFGNKGQLDFIRTQFDKEIDEFSVHKGRQTIDKLCGAMYLGELTRRVLHQLCIDRELFDGEVSEFLALPEKFHTKYLSEILCDEGRHWKNTRRILDELGISHHNTSDYIIMKHVVSAISDRSAAVVAAAISALLQLKKWQKVIVGIGGTLYQYHNTYHSLLEKHLDRLAPPNTELKVLSCEYSSGQGAALVAALAEKLKLS